MQLVVRIFRVGSQLGCVAVEWKDIHNRVKEVLREVFQGAAAVHPEMNSHTSRAIYGVDIMLDASFQPKLLEVIFKSFPQAIKCVTLFMVHCLF